MICISSRLFPSIVLRLGPCGGKYSSVEPPQPRSKRIAQSCFSRHYLRGAVNKNYKPTDDKPRLTRFCSLTIVSWTLVLLEKFFLRLFFFAPPRPWLALEVHPRSGTGFVLPWGSLRRNKVVHGRSTISLRHVFFLFFFSC